jgi:hypothetical protein
MAKLDEGFAAKMGAEQDVGSDDERFEWTRGEEQHGATDDGAGASGVDDGASSGSGELKLTFRLPSANSSSASASSSSSSSSSVAVRTTKEARLKCYRLARAANQEGMLEGSDMTRSIKRSHSAAVARTADAGTGRAPAKKKLSVRDSLKKKFAKFR